MLGSILMTDLDLWIFEISNTTSVGYFLGNPWLILITVSCQRSAPGRAVPFFLLRKLVFDILDLIRKAY